MITLETPIEQLTRVGKSTASRLHRLGIYTARDLLFHFPHRYEDWRGESKICDIHPNQDINIEGEVESITKFRSPRRKMYITEAIVSDGTGNIKVIWFNQPFLTKNLPAGTKVSLAGKTILRGRDIILQSPKYEVVADNITKIYTGRILPIYPLALNLTQKQIQFLVDHIYSLTEMINDPLPEVILQDQNFPDLKTALQFMHKPANPEQVDIAQKRFAFEEIFYRQIQSAVLKELNQYQISHQLKFFTDEIKNFVDSLPFELTTDQRKTAWKIFLDLQKQKSMNRLVQGDVGSGKTLVAALAMYNTALNGYQSVLMAPTEVLASQHFQSFSNLFAHLDIPIALFTRTRHLLVNKGTNQVCTKKDLISAIIDGDVAIAIGTHALIQPSISFKQLGLAVVDEQHRFGVDQRKLLRKQSGVGCTTPHLLSMTATPIPRTLSLVFYGDLDVSSIREMPKNRLPIITQVVLDKQRTKAYQFIWEQIKQRGQAYVVCPLIEESDKLGVTSVTEEVARLTKVFSKAKIQSLHGKMSSVEKEEVMTAFKKHQIDILVATTVIEVGVDVANANVMIIEGAERFGLSQLHQIRGRVGRGDKQSYCFLFPTENYPEVLGRLNRFVKCKDGFEVAELDLHMRGGGEILGTKQSGLMELKFVDFSDIEFIENINAITVEFLKNNKIEDYPRLADHIADLNEGVHLE